MANPRIEEVDDDSMADDPEEMDLDAFDFARPQGGSLVQTMPQMSDNERERLQREQQEKSKSFQCIYPVYFDSTRSREGGRRVAKEDAIPNPLAREIVDALSHIGNTHNVGLQIVFEPTKTHPKDWANPGRVKVEVKRDGKPVSAKIQNKHHLYKMIADYLKSHPTTEDMPTKFRLQGMPMPKDKHTAPSIPRGSKMGTILPLHSPALSGGGVSENFLKDMMAEMGGQLPPGMAGLGGGEAPGQTQKKVKDKKKK
ncbi:hypothetical protein M409DRAFT_69369 [Zasmidium cellare ATCC 36951]|uniref:Signal recognition particle SRP19 subunit n=1 Tax=Zasmidium cellare ATCC 36951 TaxID=1080233 RepID=A0A6A6C548_ZASCE|nr:uncharacterized protein M409DRAFT_69369 [Zasmidium cellare ATCC 36951]KAF2162161.1 hypothetical protein M409DRAFT_69369 [Zasmidium cellare ATCC 36951]